MLDLALPVSQIPGVAERERAEGVRWRGVLEREKEKAKGGAKDGSAKEREREGRDRVQGKPGKERLVRFEGEGFGDETQGEEVRDPRRREGGAKDAREKEKEREKDKERKGLANVKREAFHTLSYSVRSFLTIACLSFTDLFLFLL